MPLSKTQKEIITGLMLGDGHLSIGGTARNPRLRITRALKDLAYAEWIERIFYEYCTENSLKCKSVYDRRYRKTYYRALFCTRRHQDFMSTYINWYNNGPKQLPLELDLTQLTVAIWFADDGSLYAKHKNGVSSGTEIAFASCSFGKIGSERLAELLTARYNAKFKVFGGYTRAKHYKIMGATDAAVKIINDVKSVFPPVKRKIDFWESGKINLTPTPKLACPNCASKRTCKRGFYIWKNTRKQRLRCNECGFRWCVN